MSGVGTFRDLEVYERVVGLADATWGCVTGWDAFARWTVGVQLVRSVDSIGANIAEAAGRSTDADQRRFLIVARGSALELEYWLDRANERRLPGTATAVEEAKRVGRMLNGLIRSRR
jgi:four helix bundle protein